MAQKDPLLLDPLDPDDPFARPAPASAQARIEAPLAPPSGAQRPAPLGAAPRDPFGATAQDPSGPPVMDPLHGPVSDPFGSPGGPFAPLTHDPFAPPQNANDPLRQTAPPRDSFALPPGDPQMPGVAPENDFAALPRLGDVRAASLTPPLRPKHSRDDQVERAFEVAALNPLVSAAAPLLWLAARLHESTPPDDLRIFRDRVLEEIRRFESAAMARGIASRSVRVGRYVLCATIDDILLNTSWGGQSAWASGSLVSILYSETIGGERFYELLNQIYVAPEENIDVLELMALCLSIGFVGKYRVIPGGLGHLNRLRSELYRTLRQVRGPYDRDLSPPWPGVPVPHRPPPRMLPFWLIAGAALLILVALYGTLSFLLMNRIDVAAQRLANLVPSIPVLVEKPPVPAVPVPEPKRPPPPKPAGPTQIQRISAVLRDDIRNQRIQVIGTPKTVAVRLLGASFASSRVALSELEAPLIKRVASALDKEPGPIRIIGYTDNVPVSAGSAMGNNKKLSEARARTTAEMLKRYLTTPDRVSYEGRGDANPIASNATAEGRASNRRVEFEIPAENAK